MTYREKLNELRKQANFSVKRLAEAAGLKVGTVNGYLIVGPNNRLPNLKNAIKLAKALGVSIKEFEDCSDWSTPDEDSTSDQTDRKSD